MADLARRQAEIANVIRSVNPGMADELDRIAAVLVQAQIDRDPMTRALEIVADTTRREDRLAAAVEANASAAHELRASVDRLSALILDRLDHPPAPPQADSAKSLVVLVVRELRLVMVSALNVARVIPSLAWVLLAAAILAAVLGAWGLTYYDGSRTIGRTPGEPPVIPSPAPEPDGDFTLPDLEADTDPIPMWPVPAPTGVHFEALLFMAPHGADLFPPYTEVYDVALARY